MHLRFLFARQQKFEPASLYSKSTLRKTLTAFDQKFRRFYVFLEEITKIRVLIWITVINLRHCLIYGKGENYFWLYKICYSKRFIYFLMTFLIFSFFMSHFLSLKSLFKEQLRNTYFKSSVHIRTIFFLESCAGLLFSANLLKLRLSFQY